MPKAKKSLNDLLYEVKRIEEHRKELSEKKIRKIYRQLMKELNTFLGEEYVKHADDSGALSYSSLRDRARQARFLEEVASKVDSITPELKKEIMGLVETTYKNCYEGMGQAVQSAANTEELASMMSGSVLRPEVLQQSYNNNISKLTLPNVLEKHRQEIIYTIKQELTIGLLNGDRYEKMARRLTDKLDISYKKATNIVRTESHRNIEGGLTDCAERLAPTLDDSGMVMVKIWRTMKDERVRPNVVRKTKKGWKVYKSKNAANHEVMEGKVVKEGDFFEFEDGVKTKTPSHSGVAAHDCNCRCFLERDIMTEEEFAKVNANAKTTITKVTRSVEKGVENSNGSGIIEQRNISNVYTGMRSEIPLTPAEKKQTIQYLEKLGVDTDRVIFSDSQRTVYNEKGDYFVIGTDVKPREDARGGIVNANQRISMKGAIAHEVVGHRTARLKGWTQHSDILEEVQASIRAARFAPDLSMSERIVLLKDARARLGKDRTLKSVKHLLHIEEE